MENYRNKNMNKIYLKELLMATLIKNIIPNISPMLGISKQYVERILCYYKKNNKI